MKNKHDLLCAVFGVVFGLCSITASDAMEGSFGSSQSNSSSSSLSSSSSSCSSSNGSSMTLVSYPISSLPGSFLSGDLSTAPIDSTYFAVTDKKDEKNKRPATPIRLARKPSPLSLPPSAEFFLAQAASQKEEGPLTQQQLETITGTIDLKSLAVQSGGTQQRIEDIIEQMNTIVTHFKIALEYNKKMFAGLSKALDALLPYLVNDSNELENIRNKKSKLDPAWASFELDILVILRIFIVKISEYLNNFAIVNQILELGVSDDATKENALSSCKELEEMIGLWRKIVAWRDEYFKEAKKFEAKALLLGQGFLSAFLQPMQAQLATIESQNNLLKRLELTAEQALKKRKSLLKIVD